MAKKNEANKWSSEDKIKWLKRQIFDLQNAIGIFEKVLEQYRRRLSGLEKVQETAE